MCAEKLTKINSPQIWSAFIQKNGQSQCFHYAQNVARGLIRFRRLQATPFPAQLNAVCKCSFVVVYFRNLKAYSNHSSAHVQQR